MKDAAEQAELRESLLDRAFCTGHGLEYNETSYALRQERGFNQITFYEVVLLENHNWDYLRDKVFPRLVRYLKVKGWTPAHPGTLVVTVWRRERFYILEGQDFIDAVCEACA